MRWRFLPFYLVLIFSFFLLFWRLFELTVIKGSYYRRLSEENRVRQENIRAPRGIIYDRNGKVLARNKPVYKICQDSKTKCQILEREKALEIEAQGGTEAANLKIDLAREYPFGSLFAHVLGYTGEIAQEEIQDLKVKNYKLGDFIGRTGVEEEFEEILRGIDGKELIEVDALERKIRSLGRIEPKPGQDLTLSLDLSLQKITAENLKEKKGAIVVSDPKNGEILALYSSPSFDPNLINKEGYLESLENQPFFNRAIAGLYPPGSTFKIITSAAGLETGKINKDTKIEDIGEIRIGSYSFPNWYWKQYGGKDGLLDVIGAIKRSNDIFFYKVGELVGIEKLEEWAKRFGVEKILGINIPGEAQGRFRQKREWFLGDTYHTAIGQGDLEVTPLQVNFWTNVIANKGKLCQPSVVKNSNIKTKNGNEKCKSVGLSQETIDLIKEGMRQACSPGGTGWPFFNFQFSIFNFQTGKEEERINDVACKTGTAEFGDSKGRTHAWFTIFAPVNEPQISVTVLVEEGGEGSSVAAPIAKKILEEWFSRYKK